MRSFSLVVALASLVSPLHAQPIADSASVASYVTTQMERQHVPGLALAVVRSDRILISQAFGIANLELGVPASTRSVFRIGSTSKPFIATAIMLLVEDGKLSLDDEVAGFFDKAPSTWNGIQVRHLLNHTAGFPRELPDWTSYGNFSEDDFVAMIERIEPTTRPGEQHSYSNAGYFTLAAILTRVSATPWPDFLATRIFEPAGMKSTRTTTWRNLVSDRASGYFWEDGRWYNEGFILTVRPSGALLSTAEDLARWDIALRNGEIVKPKTLESMISPTTLSSGSVSAYGFGWGLEEFRGRRLVGHNGDLLGFRSAFIRDLDDDVTIIVLINCVSGNADTIAKGVLTKLVPELAVTGWPAEKDRQPDIARALRKGLQNIAANKAFGDIAAPELEEALKGVPESSRTALNDKLSPVRSVVFLREYRPTIPAEKSGQPVHRIRYYRFTGGDTPLHYATYLSASDKLLMLEAILE
jgi:CubicO group peptidase (beta-lactamase class C family)